MDPCCAVCLLFDWVGWWKFFGLLHSATDRFYTYPSGPLFIKYQVSWNLEAARLDVLMIVLLQNLTGISAEPLTRSWSSVRGIGKVRTRISRLITHVWFIAVNNESISFSSDKCNAELFGIASESRLCQIWSLIFYTVYRNCKYWDGKF